MKITIPEPSLVALIGPTGSGKSTFARKHLKPTGVLSSDYCRGLWEIVRTPWTLWKGFRERWRQR